MSQSVTELIVLVLIALAYLTVIGILSLRKDNWSATSRWLMVYLIVAATWDFVRGLLGLEALSGLEQDIRRSFSLVGLGILAAILLLVNVFFFSVRDQNRLWVNLTWTWAGLSLLASILLLILVRTDGTRFVIALGLTLVGWVAALGRAAHLTGQAYRAALQPMHRNRLMYWGISLGLIGLGDLFTLFGLAPVGETLRLLGVLAITYVLLTYNPADLFRTGLDSLRFLMVAVISMVLYVVILALTRPMLVRAGVGAAFWGVLIVAGILALLINPLLKYISRWLDRTLFTSGYNPNKVLSEYSLSISNVVNPGLLQRSAMEVMQKTIGVKSGSLWMIYESKDVEPLWQVRAIDDPQRADAPRAEYHFLATSPFSTYFLETRGPLLQYDLDFLSRFRDLLTEDRAWLAAQGADIYVPVFSKENWIGLFVLGAKSSGDRYFEEDLTLLKMLAEQTAVALENARLFGDLNKINMDLQAAHVDLEKAYVQMREVDELKSSFIGVITHELRTPLANIAFSLQLLEMYGRERMLPEQLEQLDQLTNSLGLARQMVDNLVTFALFLNKQVELRPEEFSFKMVMLEALVPLKQMADDKGVLLNIDMVGDLPPLCGDLKLLKEAMHHLVHNAIKFTPSGGKVWVSCWAAQDKVHFNVKDTGSGVPPDKMRALWDGFTQATDPLRRGLEGLGLGLALVRFIVTAHGGDVWVESEPGKGSEFGFRLPLAGPECNQTAAQHVIAKPG